MHVELALLYQIATVLNAILNIPNSPMMTKWHHSDSSMVMSEVQESVKKKTLDANSRLNLFSARLLYIIKAYSSSYHICHQIHLKNMPCRLQLMACMSYSRIKHGKNYSRAVCFYG